MILQTNIPIKKETKNPIEYTSKMVLLGSCFSENIGNQLEYYKFQTTQNPFGILFHPKAIQKLIYNAITEKKYSEDNLIFQNERWYCLDAHSSINSSDKKKLISSLHTALKSTKKKLEQATHLIITIGTSWVYTYLETDTIVANCHKIPQHKFKKRLLTVPEITESLYAIISAVKSINKKVQIVFTVSPVRHLKDGFIENQLSKSHLITAIHQLLDCARSDIRYFPSYEIMMDELRDYRFYAEDMIHPNKTAIKYIWQQFSTTWISSNSEKNMQEIEVIQKGMAHKPFNEKSVKHQQFLKNLETKKEKIMKRFPFIVFE
ncbi:MAG: GSCFA domain-containing protein [Polaribacter sp.]